MSRLARIIVPHYPHHIIQRGNRSQQVFFSDYDRRVYLKLLREQSKKDEFELMAYCLMDNHVHLVVVPQTQAGLSRGIAEVHRRYTCMINARMGWRGYLWQGRFKSYVMNERYLLRAVRYIERNPIAAGIVRRAEEYKWSSAYAHVLNGADEVLSKNVEYIDFSGWNEYVNTAEDNEAIRIFKMHEMSGQPLDLELGTH